MAAPRDLVNVEVGVVLIAVGIIAVASCVQASVGFGANLLATPVFALIDPDLVPGPIFFSTSILTLATALREHEDIDWTAVKWGTLGRIPGALLGAFVLARATDTSLQTMVALSILVAIVLSSGRIRLPTAPAAFVGAGTVSGFGATTVGIGGPPFALLLQHHAGPRFRSTMGAYFSIGAVVTLPAIAAAGRLGRDEIVVGLALIPGALAGFAASGPLRKHVDAGRVRPLVLLLAGAVAVILLIRVAL